MTGEASRRSRIGAAVALVVFALYGGMSLTVDLPATIGGFYSDNTRTKGGQTFVYKVCEYGSTTACSPERTIVF